MIHNRVNKRGGNTMFRKDKSKKLDRQLATLSDHIFNYLDDLIRANPEILANIALGLGSEGRIFLDLIETHKKVSLLKPHEAIKKSLRKQKAIHSHFLTQIESFTPGYNEKTVERVSRLVSYYYEHLFTNNVRWEAFCALQKQAIRKKCLERHLNKLGTEEALTQLIDASWHKLENDLVGAIVFRIQAYALPDKEAKNVKKQSLLSLYQPLINAGLDTEKAFKSQFEKMVATIAGYLDPNVYTKAIAENNKALLIGNCAGLSERLNSENSILANPKVIGFGLRGEIEVITQLRHLLETINCFEGDKELKSLALTTLSDSVLQLIHSKYRLKIEFISPHLINELYETMQIAMLFAGEGSRRLTEALQGVLASHAGENYSVKTPDFVESAPDFFRLPEPTLDMKLNSRTGEMPRRHPAASAMNPRSLDDDKQSKRKSLQLHEKQKTLTKTKSGSNLREMLIQQVKEKQESSKHATLRSEPMTRSGGFISSFSMLRAQNKHEKAVKGEDVDVDSKQQVSYRN